MKLIQDKKLIINHLISVLIMVAASIIYCLPVTTGKVIVQDDISVYTAQSKETRDLREKTGEEALWTSRVFGGMTTFNISTIFKADIMYYIDSMIKQWLPAPVNIIFVTMLGIYLLMLALGVNPWLSLVAAIGYGLSSNLIVSIVAGHNTKVITIGYMAFGVAGSYLVYHRKQLSGALLVALGSGLMLRAAHYQIIYYFILISAVMAVVYFLSSLKEKTISIWTRALAIIIISAVLGVLPSAGKAYNVYDHTAATIRGGKSTLDQDKTESEKTNKGLDIDYAMRWSYGPLETFTGLIPSFNGGASGEALSESSKVAEALNKYNLNKQQKSSILEHAPLYTGDQPFILGPVYFGAAFIFLFILALFIAKGPIRSWVLGSIAVSFVISWGSHISPITSFLFEYFPLYNKFRTPSMALSIAGLMIPSFGILGLSHALNKTLPDLDFSKAFKRAVYATAVIMLLLLFYGLTNDWVGTNDASLQVKNSPWSYDDLYNALKEDRKSRFIGDWTISLLVIALTAAITSLLRKGKIGAPIAYTILIVTIGGDMARVSKRYLNSDDFKNERDFEKRFAQSAVDETILKDSDPHHRVINLSVSPWTDGLTSYYHENIGGHHAAKLQRYQELIENQLSPQIQNLQKGLRQQGERIYLDSSAASMLPVYNMLNTKYFILQPNNPGGFAQNPAACGNAWFVNEIQKVNTARQEMDALGNFDPMQTAIVSDEFEDDLYNYNFSKTENASITLTEFEPNRLKYTSKNGSDGLAVFSEIYYQNGWEAFVDNQPTEIYRVNYLLRGLKIPAGEHEIIMVFNPKSYSIGQNMTYAGSALFILFLGVLVFLFRKQNLEIRE